MTLGRGPKMSKDVVAVMVVVVVRVRTHSPVRRYLFGQQMHFFPLETKAVCLLRLCAKFNVIKSIRALWKTNFRLLYYFLYADNYSVLPFCTKLSFPVCLQNASKVVLICTFPELTFTCVLYH